MKREKFLDDLQRIYDELQRRQEALGEYLRLAKGEEHPEAEALVERFLKKLGLPRNDESVMAALTRLVNLREDALEQVMQREGFDEERIIAA